MYGTISHKINLFCLFWMYLPTFNDYHLLINWEMSFFHIHYIIEVWIKFLSQWTSDTSEKRSFWKDQYCPATCIGICKTWVVLQKPESEIWSFLLQANLFGWQFWQISRLISFFMTLKVRKLLQVVSSSVQDIKVVKSTILFEFEFKKMLHWIRNVCFEVYCEKISVEITLWRNLTS